jgi:hypothetical protein
MKKDKQTNPGKPRETLRWRVFLAYLGASLGMILGLNIILIINNTKLFGGQSLLVGIVLIGVMYVVLSFIFWLIIKKLLFPLTDIIKSIQVFLEGNWEQRIYIQNNDETGILAEQFNVILEEMVNLYVAHDQQTPDEKPSLLPSSFIPPNLSKMDATRNLDELLEVTTRELIQEMRSDRARIILIKEEPDIQKPGLVQIINGNGHEVTKTS